MSAFSGFPAKTLYTPVPRAFVTQLLPGIHDLEELKVSLAVFEAIAQKRGVTRFVTLSELLADRGLLSGFRGDQPAEGQVHGGLSLAVQRGTLLRLVVEQDGHREETYWLNTPSSQRAIERVKSGELPLGNLPSVKVVEVAAQEKPGIFELYEQNIGLLTPYIAEELKEAEGAYPTEWIPDAFKLAVKLNKRRWSTIASILSRWEKEGKDDGEPRRNPQEKDDPAKYTRGRYGHVVRQ